MLTYTKGTRLIAKYINEQMKNWDNKIWYNMCNAHIFIFLYM